MKAYFPDTNFFLECRKASDLQWHELESAKPSQAPDIRLIVPPTVITEIERHKAKGNSRTAKRARETSATLRQALTSPDQVTELRPANPRVILALPPVVKVDFSQFPNLDPTRPDHRIAAEYAEILKIEPSLTVLTDDTLLTLAVRSLGFDPVLIPESWKLAPERDERDDELERLKEELRTYKQASPTMSLTLLDGKADEIEIMEARIHVFDPSPEEIEYALASVQAHFPMTDDFSRSPPVPASPFAGRIANLVMGTWRPPREEDIETYKTKGYPQWLESVRNALPVLAHRLNTISHETPFLIRVSNTGFANASHVRLTITAYDGILLLDSLSEKAEAKREETLVLPSRPVPPRGKYVSAASILSASAIPQPLVSGDFLRSLSRPLPTRDPNDFYYADGRPDSPAEELELTCEAFPHQADPYSLAFRAVIPDGNMGRQPRLRVRLQASNLRKPIMQYIRVSITVERGDFIHQVNEIMKKS